MAGQKNERVSVQLTVEERAWVKAQAEAADRSESWVLVELVRAAREGRAPKVSR